MLNSYPAVSSINSEKQKRMDSWRTISCGGTTDLPPQIGNNYTLLGPYLLGAIIQAALPTSLQNLFTFLNFFTEQHWFWADIWVLTTDLPPQIGNNYTLLLPYLLGPIIQAALTTLFRICFPSSTPSQTRTDPVPTS